MTRTPQLFRLDASLAGETSVSRSVADTFEKVWRLEHPDGTVLRRDLGAAPVPFIDMTAVGARFTPAEDRTPEQRAAVELAETLTDELLSSDAYLFAVPLYNWTNPASVQAWVDRILTAAPLRAGEGEPIAGPPRRGGPQPGRWLRPRYPTRGLGPRRALPAPDPRGRLEARRHDGDRRADPGRDGAGDG